MTGKEIQEVAMRIANSLPAVTQTQPFGFRFDVFKVYGKVFAMTAEVSNEKIITLKCDPDRSIMLCDVHTSIKPGYHMNKRHWISIGAGPQIDPDLVEVLITDAYKLVTKTLPKKKQLEIKRA